MIRNPINLTQIFKRWATNLGGGSTTNGRDSAGKRLGIKLGNGSKCKTGQIIVRQRGFQYYPGQNVKIKVPFINNFLFLRLESVEIIRFGQNVME